MKNKFQDNSIYWIEIDKIKPNPYQPRKSFSDEKLNYLAESIRQYGILQPLVVTRKEVKKQDGGLMSEYELIAGERRLRASKIAGLVQVPVIIRTEDEEDGVKLELAIIENIQREDLNPIDRAVAFQQLAEEFNFKHTEIAKKVGKSREYVSNSIRLLTLSDEIKNSISAGHITEGHARPLLMLKDRPEEQNTLYKEITYKKLTVRDAEAIARKVAYDKVRKKNMPPDPEMMEIEGQLSESFGTRVQIEKKEVGGKVTIDFFSNEDLKKILDLVHTSEKKSPNEMLDNYIKANGDIEKKVEAQPMSEIVDTATDEIDEQTQIEIQEEAKIVGGETPTTEVVSEEVKEEEPEEKVEEVKISTPAVDQTTDSIPTPVAMTPVQDTVTAPTVSDKESIPTPALDQTPVQDEVKSDIVEEPVKVETAVVTPVDKNITLEAEVQTPKPSEIKSKIPQVSIQQIETPTEKEVKIESVKPLVSEVVTPESEISTGEKKTKIVLIEDDEVLARVVREELVEVGYNVVGVFDGSQGIPVIKTEKPDLVLLDLMLPNKHGFEILEELKKDRDTESIPVIVLTMLGSDDDIKKGVQLGADDYIVKSQHTTVEIIEKVKEFFGEEKKTSVGTVEQFVKTPVEPQKKERIPLVGIPTIPGAEQPVSARPSEEISRPPLNDSPSEKQEDGEVKDFNI